MPKRGLIGQSAVPVFLRFDEAPDCVDLVRKVREYLTLTQIRQLAETLVLHGATEMQELLLQLRLFPCPNRRTVAMPRFLPVGPCVPAEVFQQRSVRRPTVILAQVHRPIRARGLFLLHAPGRRTGR